MEEPIKPNLEGLRILPPNKEDWATAMRSQLAQRLREAVRAAGGNAVVAQAASVSESTLNKWLAGSEPGVLNLSKVADAVSVSLDYLAGRTQVMSVARHVPAPDNLITNVYNLKPPEIEAAMAWRAAQASGRAQDPSTSEVSVQPAPKPGPAIPISPDDALPDDFVAIPHLAVHASAGLGLVATGTAPEVVRLVAFRKAWLRRLGIAPQNAELVEARGDSMEPTIHDGDLMLLDRGYGEVVNGKIYVLVVDDLIMVKRVSRLAFGGMTLISDNERYPAETFKRDEASRLNFQARVAWYGRAI